MTRIAIAGALGRMGTMVRDEAKKAGDMETVAGFGNINIKLPDGLEVSVPSRLREVLASTRPEVLMDFTVPSAAVETACTAADMGVNLVIGTTGFSQEQLSRMRQAIDGRVAAVISPNFIPGVNIFWKLLGVAALALKDYDIEVIEAHHNQKKDAPSGTAMAAVEILKNALGTDEVVYGRKGIALRGKEIGVHAVRAGEIVGDHTVLFAGPGERLEIKHQAHSRAALASGAIMAARWVAGAVPGIYSMADVLKG